MMSAPFTQPQSCYHLTIQLRRYGDAKHNSLKYNKHRHESVTSVDYKAVTGEN